MIFQSILLFLIQNRLCNCVKMYHNFTLFRAIPVNEEQVKFLQNLPEVYDAQIWKPSSLILRSVDFTISPEDKSDFLKEANKTQMYLTTISSNVQQLFNQQTVKTYIRRQMSTYDWRNYYRVNDIYNWLKDLSYTYQKIMKLIKIGTTVENRTIFAVRISHDLYDKSFKRSTVIVEGGIHAREWISVAFVTYFLHKVLNAPSDTDEEFQRIAFAYDWVFVPLLYPDGYEYTHTQDRLWRKNCNMDGVDLNRNFDVGFGSVGVSEIKSSEIYCGPRAFSEKESSAMRSLLDKFKGKITHYVAFHAYGQYMIIPYAHIKEHVENYDDIFHLGKQMASRIKRRYGTEYVVGTAYDTVGYMTSGVSGCWAKRHHNIPYVMTFELRDQGLEGFALSPRHILPTCKETIDGLLTFFSVKDNMYFLNKKTSGCIGCCLKNFVLLLNFIIFIILCFE